MPNKVELYVYDLSNGLARTLSRQLTGRQIDGIWYVLHVALSAQPGYILNVQAYICCYIWERNILRSGHLHYAPRTISRK